MKKITTIPILVVVIFVTYEKICEYIYDIPKFTKKNGLEHTKGLLGRLGNPERRFEVIHVAGSNGKGSVCAFINSVLCEAGLAVGMFTSPHLVCMEERFQINGRKCRKEDFIWAFEQVKQAVEQMEQDNLSHPSFFEYLFVMGMLIFDKYHVKYLILETGLGGRLDATNIFEEPLMTIITSISLEHTTILGDTIEEIAGEKAGIIKECVPLVFDANEERAAAIIRKRAKEKRAPYYAISNQNIKKLERNGKYIDFCFSSGYDEVNLRIPFLAEYQVRNASLAYQVLHVLSTELGIYPGQIIQGMAGAKWQGRMQEVADGVYFDGAHNADGVKAFLDTVRQIGGEEPLLLFSMVCEKDYHKVIRFLAEDICWGEVILTKIPDERGLEPELLEAEFLKYAVNVSVIYECRQAYEYAVQKKNREQKLFCAGSLYLIGELEKITGGNEFGSKTSKSTWMA